MKTAEGIISEFFILARKMKCVLKGIRTEKRERTINKKISGENKKFIYRESTCP